LPRSILLYLLSLSLFSPSFIVPYTLPSSPSFLDPATFCSYLLFVFLCSRCLGHLIFGFCRHALRHHSSSLPALISPFPSLFHGWYVFLFTVLSEFCSLSVPRLLFFFSPPIYAVVVRSLSLASDNVSMAINHVQHRPPLIPPSRSRGRASGLLSPLISYPDVTLHLLFSTTCHVARASLLRPAVLTITAVCQRWRTFATIDPSLCDSVLINLHCPTTAFTVVPLYLDSHPFSFPIPMTCCICYSRRLATLLALGHFVHSRHC